MGKKQTTTQTSSPWKAAQPYLLGAMGNAQDLFNSGGFAPVPYGFGQFAQPNTSTAGPSPQRNPPAPNFAAAASGTGQAAPWSPVPWMNSKYSPFGGGAGAGNGNSGDWFPTPSPGGGSGGTPAPGVGTPGQASAYNPFAGMTPAQMEQAAQQAAQMQVPGFSDTTQNAMQSIINQGNLGGQGIQRAQSYLTGLMGGGSGLAPGMQSYLSGMMGGQGGYPGMQGVRDNILGSAIPAAASMFSGSGLTNSSMAQEGVGRAATEALAPFEYGAYENAQNRGLTAAGMRQGAYGDAQNRGLQAAGMMPGMEQAAYLPAQMQLGMGQLQDQMNQNRATAAQQAYGQASGLQAANFQPYLNAIMGLGGMGSSGSTTAPQPGTGVGPAVMGGLGTYGALAGIPGISGGMAGIGGLLAGLAGLSDRRAKEDIQRIGRTDGGSPVYKYRYKGTQDWHIGVMADENPHAIKGYINGYALVDYGSIH